MGKSGGKNRESQSAEASLRHFFFSTVFSAAEPETMAKPAQVRVSLPAFCAILPLGLGFSWSHWALSTDPNTSV